MLRQWKQTAIDFANYTQRRIVDTFYGGLFAICVALALILCSPFMACFGLLYLIYWFVSNLHFVAVTSFDFLKDKIALTLVCILGGLLLGICGGQTGAAMGAFFGFILGIILEITKWVDNSNIRATQINGSGGWYMPFDDGNYTANNNGLVRTRAVRSYEKPWVWKGFQVHEGPKEDRLRRDF